MSFKHIKNATSMFFKDQQGMTFTEIALVLIGITIASIAVSFITLGTSLFTVDASSGNINSTSSYKISSGAFSPITELEKQHLNNPERIDSTVKGAIADLESFTDNKTADGL
ncbi:MAG: hypothetical protein JXA01_00360 [Dehalococcoidia bacterium]|nr:hypothetical protein [Dehalococcoidia bacterium]